MSINSIIRHPLEKVMLLVGRFGVPRWVKAIGNDSMEQGCGREGLRSSPAAFYLPTGPALPGGPGAPRHESPARLLLFSSTVDHVVPPANQREIHDSIGSRDKTLVTLDDCYHLATMDRGRERVFTGVLEFVAAHSAAPPSQ